MPAFVFRGQGAQYPGMGKEIFSNNSVAKEYFLRANEILGFEITQIMFGGTAEDLKETKVTQPAVFLHSVINVLSKGDFSPEMVAGHSLGEFSALSCAGCIKFSDTIKILKIRLKKM